VFTSGNLADEPQCIDLPSARAKLGTIADYLLMHDREIVNRLDDSVVQIVERQPQILRRARGYAPTPISLPPGCDRWPSILAMGSELKNTFCLVRSGQAILSPHLGDLESAAPNYERTLNWYLNLFDHHPTAIAVDLHPEYLSTKLGQALAIANDLPIYPIQHHHAHIAACMVENQIPADTTPLLGIALDGLGYGEDGTIWGGEFLLADYRSFQRVAKFPSIAMLGGTQAIYQPWRNTYAHLIATFGWEELRLNYGDLELVSFLTDQPRSLLDRMLTTGINSPLASSAGRLFDAVAAALGICRSHCSYEGQGAITLESMATEFLAAKSGQQSAEKNAYPCPIKRPPGEPLTLGFRPLWQSLLQDLQQGLSQPEIAARFHLGLAHAIVNLTLELRQQYPCDRVALTGGVFQNALLQQQVKQHLSRSGFTVLTHHLVPSNDGGLSLGQGTIAAVRVGLLG
jgi:hydrogenase maturation protein HypF